MTALPPNRLIEMIDAATVAANNDKPRTHLGASVIGHPCERWLWFSFRWFVSEQFSGRMLRLFRRGQNEEATVLADLRAAGLVISEVDPATGRQWRFDAGHFGGSCDGIIESGVPESPNKRHVLEIKTHSLRSFNDLTAKGVEKSKPQHFAQMQTYMAAFDVDRALYVAVCKDNDALHIERIKHDPAVSRWCIDRAQRIVFDNRLPAPVSNLPTWYQCKFCPASDICHKAAPPEGSNCRMCQHSSALEGGAWHCSRWDCEIPTDAQRAGCERFVLHPDIVPF